MPIESPRSLLAFLAIASVLAAEIRAQDAGTGSEAASTTDAGWSRFRGPNGTGLGAGPFPVKIGPDQKVVWKRAFPPGHSSPVFSREHIYLTAVEDEKLYTFALHRETGATVWKKAAPRPRRTKFHAKNGPAGATPAVDADTVVVFFDEFGALAYDHAGEERWRKPLGPFNNIYGMAASPVIIDDVVVIPCDQGTGSFVLGLDKKTGKQAFKIARPMAVSGHCTPVVYEPKKGNKQFILPGSFLLDAYDAKTGERVWWINGLPAEMKSVPVLIGETLWIHGFGSPIQNKGRQVDLPKFAAALEAMDKDGDALIGRDELTNRNVRRYFQFEDLDSSGKLDAHEWSLVRASFASVNSAMRIKVGGAGDMTEKSVKWRYYRSIPQLPSPLILGNTYFLVADQGGLVRTVTADKGEQIENGRLKNAVDNYFASPVGGDGHVYILSESGILTVLDVDKGLEPVHTAEFGEPCYATPALVDGCVWLRTHDHMYRLGKT